MANKWVYLFSEGNAQMRDLLGGKGAGVAEMTHAGLPVSQGFTITTEACNAYYDSGKQFPDGMWEQAMEALAVVEAQRVGRDDRLEGIGRVRQVHERVHGISPSGRVGTARNYRGPAAPA